MKNLTREQFLTMSTKELFDASYYEGNTDGLYFSFLIEGVKVKVLVRLDNGMIKDYAKRQGQDLNNLNLIDYYQLHDDEIDFYYFDLYFSASVNRLTWALI